MNKIEERGKTIFSVIWRRFLQALEDGQRPLAVRDRRLGGGTIEKIRCKIENASFSKMRSKFLRC